MALINRYRYLQAIFIGLPMGIASLYYGTKDLASIKQNVNDYPCYHGIVDSVYSDYISDNLKNISRSNVLLVRVSGDNFYVVYGKHKNILLTSLNNQDSVSIWYQIKDNGNKKIKAIKKGEVDIIKYEQGGYWVGIFFITWGMFWAIISFLYIIRHPEDLTH